MATLILLAALCGLFIFRFIRNRKLYDLLVFMVLVLAGLTKLPIGKSIPTSFIITAVLGIGVVIALLFVKEKSDALKKQNSIDETKK